MNDHEYESFEADLGRLKPAAPPADFMARLTAARPEPRVERQIHSRRGFALLSSRWDAWLAPLSAVAVALVWLLSSPSARPGVAAAQVALNADNVEINRNLVAAFDVIAQTPGGPPMRFRCRDWNEDVVLRDSSKGIVVEQRGPHLEIVPVRFEMY